MNSKILQEVEKKKKAEEEKVKERMMKVQKQKEQIRSLMGDSHHLLDLRIVLLGNRAAGKSSAGNTILNREEFELKRTAQCVKRHVAERHITVVEAPGWWRNMPVERSTELLKQEIVLSVSLCPPGPHAVLLVIRVDSVFKKNYRNILEGYLKLLTDTVWSHTIVLFTCGDCLGDTPIEQHIESEGKDLHWLVEKCGNRYHVLNNKNRSDDSQVTELLEKIEEMVAANSGHHFEMDRKILQEVEEKRRAEEERVKERMMKVQKQREHIRSLMGDSYHLSDLRIVLLGYRAAGKSSAGNTILNREEFELKRTAQCVKRQREVAERHSTVVEAPGWWRDKPVEESTELLKQEIVLSVSLCPPGPHALLLVMCVDSVFKEIHRSILEGHLKLLTDTAWSHTIVLFTRGDSLGDTPIEQYIESEGKDLQWLVEKCGNRYHVLNNMNRSDDSQVTELLEKIEEMVAGNSGRHFEMDRKILHKLEKKRKARDKRAKERMMKVQKQKKRIRSLMGDSHRLSDLRIVLLGYRYSGKSSAGNTILNREEFELKRTAQCVKRQGEVAERHITVVEAPGWWRDKPVEESTELLKQEILLSVQCTLCPPGPHAVLLIVRVDSVFKENQRNILEEHLKLLTDTVWSHTIVLFTCGDCLGDTPIEQYIESEGKDLQWLVEKCGNRYHVLNNKNRRDDTQVTELLEKIEEMVAANSGRHFEMDRKILQEVEEKRRAEEERVKERMMKVQKWKKYTRSLMDDSHHLSELRIVLLGYRDAGKSSTGNTILNREEFELQRTAQCVKRQREVAERHITVVEAPGWCIDEPVKNSTELFKQEIVLSVSLCPPEPHAVLVVMRVDSVFKENSRNILEGYLKLLTDTVWSHTIVLFTCGDYLGDTPIEQHIESEGKDLQWLVEKCGNRYHVLNNMNSSDDSQVTELLEKIEEMVSANSGCHFEMDRKILQEVEEQRRAEEERAKEKMMKLQKKLITSQMLTEDERSDTWSLASSGYVSMSGSDNSSVHGLSRTNSCESIIHDHEPMQHLKYRTSRKYGQKLLLPFFKHKTRSANTRGLNVNTSTCESNYYSEGNLYRDSVSSCDLVVEDSSSASAQHPYTEHLSTVTEGFSPEMIESSSEAKNVNWYRFLCPHAGQFRCRVTYLMFEMEDKGEVLYRIDSWDPQLLDGLGQMEPAGPLYNIDCFEGSISHLHLPHCEIQYEANQAGLVVAHFTGENVEVIPPVKVTNSHVIFSVQDFSLFGLLKKIIPASPISAQILLFHKEMIGKKGWKQLHIHLLPVNIPVEEVGKKHKDTTYFETSSTCQLTTGKKYKPTCDPHVCQPKVAKFVRDYGPNYHPTFVVFFEAEHITVSILNEDGIEVWEPHWIFLTNEKPGHRAETSPLKMDAGAEFVDKNRQKLIQRVPSVMEIADCLKCKSMITDEMYCSVQAGKTSQDQMRIMYRFLDSGGKAVKEEFYEILQRKQRFLVDDLRGPAQQILVNF